MKWLSGNSSNFNQIEKVSNTGEKYTIKLSPRSYTPEQQEESEGVVNTDNIQYIEVVYDKKPSTFDIKQILISLVKKYDESDEVNVFYVNGQKAWMDKATRVGLVNSCNVVEANGGDEYTVYLNGTPLVLKISLIRQILNAVEFYAMQCYSITERHLAEINNMNGEDDILSYDISKDYPEKISLQLPIN